MNQFEKSKLLVKITKRDVMDPHSNVPGMWLDTAKQLFPVPNLYEPENMHLAWQILNWIPTVPHGPLRVTIAAQFDLWWGEAELYAYPPEEAIQQAFDKLIELAMESGIFERTVKNGLETIIYKSCDPNGDELWQIERCFHVKGHLQDKNGILD